MEDSSLVSCAGLALLALYAALVLRRGAVTPARKALSRMLGFLSAYASFLFLRYVLGPAAPMVLIERVAVFCGACAMAELAGLGLWHARASRIEEGTWRPRPFFVVVALALGAFAVRIAFTARSEAIEWSYTGLLAMVLVLVVVSTVTFAIGALKRVRGSRRYFFACLWVFAPVVANLVSLLGAQIPLPVFRLLRDLSLLMFTLSLLTAYLDEGHEPMSLRERITASTLMVVLALATICAHLLLPRVTGGSAGLGALPMQRGALRLLLELVLATGAVVVLAPRVFKTSVLDPLERLTVGLGAVEAGGQAELPFDRKDELGRVARSFNTMVGVLAEDRASQKERLVELEARQIEIETLNKELKRQIAARSRQLADVLRDVDRSVRPVRPGALVDERYLVDEPIGRGGMGMVFGVTRSDDSRPLALKVMHAGSPEDAVRFMREAEIAATLDHPHLVSVIDVGMFKGTPYFVMERLGGGALGDRLDRFGDLAFMLPILVQVADGLAELHERGVTHRDLKPANVLLDGDAASPLAKIGDFGIARSSFASPLAATVDVAGSTANAMASTTGTVMGTLPYMAPELAQGPSGFGPASDVFAFGVLAWEVLMSSLPFEVPAVLTAQDEQDFVRPKCTLSNPRLSKLLLSCVEIEPAKRPSAAVIAKTLRQAREDSS